MNEKTNLPPIADLFAESWNVFKQSVLNLLIIFLISLGIYIGLALILVILFFIFGVGAALSNPEAGIANLFTNPIGILGTVITSVIGIVAFSIIAMIAQIANIKAVFNADQKPSPITLLKQSKNLILPVFIVNSLIGILVLGGIGLFVIPGMIFALLFSFSLYEVVLNNQRGTNALRRSFALFASDFWNIFLRMLIISVSIYIITYFLSRNNQMGIIATVINIVLGWFSLCYSVVLYRQVIKHHQDLPGKSIKGIVVASIFGLILFVLFLGGMIALAVNVALPALEKSRQTQMDQKINDVDQEIDPNQMPSEQELNEMLKQLPEGQTMQLENEAI